MKLSICSIDSRYINFLRSDPRLVNVYDNKDTTSVHGRKYLGVVLDLNVYKYYVPLSSPKISDYDNSGNIRKSIIPIMRIVCPNSSGIPELKASLRFSHMIPVPNCAVVSYDINTEQDRNYKILLTKEYNYINSNQNAIYKNAKVIYRQRTVDDSFYNDKFKPGYLAFTIDFNYAEQMCDKYLFP